MNEWAIFRPSDAIEAKIEPADEKEDLKRAIWNQSIPGRP
jgi:hypothetical protein